MKARARGAPLAVDVPIPGMRLPSLMNVRDGWRARARRAKQQRSIVALVLRGTVARLMMAMAPLDVVITRSAPSRGLDSDNLAACAKHVRDQVAAELGVDDADPRVTWTVVQRRGPWGIQIAIAVSPPPKGRAS